MYRSLAKVSRVLIRDSNAHALHSSCRKRQNSILTRKFFLLADINAADRRQWWQDKTGIELIFHHKYVGSVEVGYRVKQLSLNQIRNHSIFNRTRNKYDDRQWRNGPLFMGNASPDEKDQWLKSILTKDRFKENDIDGKHEINLSGLRIDSEAYLFVLKALSTSKINSAPQKCEEILSKLERKFDAANEMYDQMITGKQQSDQETIAIVKEIVLDLKPTTECYNEVIRAWSNSHTPIIARAERWLNTLRRNREYYNTLLEDQKQQNKEVTLDQNEFDSLKKATATTESYNLFLNIISKGNAKKRQKLIDNATKSKELLGEMITIHDKTGDSLVQPNTESFNFVLRSITRCREDPDITEKLMDTLRVMELLQRNADDPDNAVVKPNTMTYCLAIDSFGIAAYQKAKALSRSNNRHQNIPKQSNSVKDDKHLDNDPYKEIAKGESILKYMHDLHDAGNFDVVPNVVAYNTILSSYARVSSERFNDAPMRAEGVMRDMIEMSEKKGRKEIYPDTKTYNAIIRCWANSKETNAGARSEWWLRRMMSDGEPKNTQPDIQTYNAVMLAYHNINKPFQAEKLLKELMKLEERDDTEIRPNSESFAVVIRSWLKHARDTADFEGCYYAYEWLSMLLEREDRDFDVTSSPEVFYQIMKTIEILSRDNQDKALLNLALKTFSKLQTSRHHLDTMSYMRLLQMGIRILDGPLNYRHRMEFIRTVVSSCCDDGLLSKHVVAVLKIQYINSHKSKDEIRSIGKEFFNWPLPSDYSRNIKEHNLLPSKMDFAFFKI